MSSLSFTSRILVAGFLLVGIAYGGVPNPHRRRVDGEGLAETNTDQFLSSFLSSIPDHGKSDPIKVSPYTTVSDPVPVTKPRVQNIEPRTDVTGGLLGTFAAVVGGAVAKFLAFLFKKKLIIAAILVGILASLGLTATVSQDLVKVAHDVVAEHRLQKGVDGQVDDPMDPVKIAEETESLFSWILNMFNFTSWFGGGDANYSLSKDKTKELSSDPVQQSSDKEISAELPGSGSVDLIKNTIVTTDRDVIDGWKEENSVVNPFTVADPESLTVDKGEIVLPDSDMLTFGVSSVLNEDILKSEEIQDLRFGRKAAEDDSGSGEVKRIPENADLTESDEVTKPAFMDPEIEEISLNSEVFEEQHVKDVMPEDQLDDGEMISVGKVASIAGKNVLGNGDTKYPKNEELPGVFENSQATVESARVESEVPSLLSADHLNSGFEVNEDGPLVGSNKITASELEPTVSGALPLAPRDQSQNLSDYGWLSDQAEARDTLAVGEDTDQAAVRGTLAAGEDFQELVEPAVPGRSDPIVLKLMSNVDSGVGEGYATGEDDGHEGVTDGYRDLLATLRTVELELEHTTKPSKYEEGTS